MANTYSLPLTTDRDRVRLKIGDTNTSTYWFEDEEVDEFLDEAGTVKGAAILALQTLLASKAVRVKRGSAHGVSYDDTAQIAALRGLLEVLGGDLPTIDVTLPALLPSDGGFEL